MIILKNINTKNVQEQLNEHGFSVVEDGIFGEETKKAILNFQIKRGLYSDGIIGSITWSFLSETPDTFNEPRKKLKWIKVNCDQWISELKNGKKEKSFKRTTLREDASKSFQRIVNEVRELGGLITSSGGRRMLNASVGPNRSKTSNHYLGIAHDLYIRSGMINPEKDIYVIVKTKKEGEFWTVFARTKKGEKLKLKGYTYNHEEIEVVDKFINLTKIFKREGWNPIPPRKSFFLRGHFLGSEWWHFQYEKALTPKKSTFGEELLKSHKRKDLEKYKLWDYRLATWKVDWF